MVIENSIKIFSGPLPVENSAISLDSDDFGNVGSIIYIGHLNCYLLTCDDKFYRKDIDDEDPYHYIKIHHGTIYWGHLCYSKLNRRLIFRKGENGDNFAVMNLLRGRERLEIVSNQFYRIEDFRLFGPKEDKIVLLTDQGCVSLLFLNFDMKKICSTHNLQINLVGHTSESAGSISLCDNDKYILATFQSYWVSTRVYSRLLIFKVKGHRLIQIGSVDEIKQEIGFKHDLRCLGHVGKDILWAGLISWNKLLQFYKFNTESRELRELIEKRINHTEH